MPKSDDFNKKPPVLHAPLQPAQEESEADFHTTQLHIGHETRKNAPQHTSRMPAPVMSKPKKKSKKKKAAQVAVCECVENAENAENADCAEYADGRAEAEQSEPPTEE